MINNLYICRFHLNLDYDFSVATNYLLHNICSFNVNIIRQTLSIRNVQVLKPFNMFFWRFKLILDITISCSIAPLHVKNDKIRATAKL